MESKNNPEKNKYREIRDNLKISREKASELLGWIPPERIERIETNKFDPNPDEVKAMAEAYNAPELCNYYCVNQCEIGREMVPEVNISHVSQIILAMLDSLNEVEKSKDRLVGITVDGVISDDELEEFIKIQDDLERISMTVSALQLWVERKKNNGKINSELYEKLREGRDR